MSTNQRTITVFILKLSALFSLHSGKKINVILFFYAEKQKKTGIAPKTSIFSRLGKEVSTTTKSPGGGPTITITGLGDLTLPESSTSQVCSVRKCFIVLAVKRLAPEVHKD